MSAATVVAIAGLSATTITALGGFALQAHLARRAEHRRVRETRYAELIAVYAEAGRTLSAMTITLVEGLMSMKSTLLGEDQGAQRETL